MQDAQPPPEEDEEPPSTPFDKPWFLPVVLWALTLWFGYDAFLNTDEHMQTPSTLWFNRIGFPILTVLSIFSTRRALREQRAQADDSGE